MSQLTANTILPLISALPENEKHVLRDMLNKMMGPQKPRRKKEDIYDEIGDIYRPENREMLVAQIMNNG